MGRVEALHPFHSGVSFCRDCAEMANWNRTLDRTGHNSDFMLMSLENMLQLFTVILSHYLADEETDCSRGCH